jgi:hypothetical protein
LNLKKSETEGENGSQMSILEVEEDKACPS